VQLMSWIKITMYEMKSFFSHKGGEKKNVAEKK
jgi:hypothetical protein